jgi:hypothetical protein
MMDSLFLLTATPFLSLHVSAGRDADECGAGRYPLNLLPLLQ